MSGMGQSWGHSGQGLVCVAVGVSELAYLSGGGDAMGGLGSGKR